MPNDPKGQPQWWRCFSVVKEKQCQQRLNLMVYPELHNLNKWLSDLVRDCIFWWLEKQKCKTGSFSNRSAPAAAAVRKQKHFIMKEGSRSSTHSQELLLCSSHNENRKSECCCCCLSTRWRHLIELTNGCFPFQITCWHWAVATAATALDNTASGAWRQTRWLRLRLSATNV